ncbi:lipase/acyltransferase domain-containing protein [Streptomyces sp. NBC_00690]|uniref:lipase/acyltransferase domain-containing protein n=1 Tax=Streptomyces sp. NBC_00690 TaxID=2975808 RepID=UPI002E27FB02|nr:hypothetical protein [Streptomyces sp. NBC_00690]
MGSELVDTSTGDVLWGVPELFRYTIRRHRRRLRSLALTDEERAGRIGRVTPRALLSVCEWLPGLGGIEPYSRLVGRLRRGAVHPAAVLPFPYDWRLSVRHNGALLAEAAHRHLEAWRAHPAHTDHMIRTGEDRPAGILFVAHSMGGLLIRELFHIPGAADEIRGVITAGTPFQGSVKAVLMMNSGRGAPLPLPADVLREITHTMPGLYDLLPSYRCLQDGDDMRALTVSDITALGGDRGLTEDSLGWQRDRAGTALSKHSMIVGTEQPTAQSFRMDAGRAVAQHHMVIRRHGELRRDEGGKPVTEDRRGDGTVYRFAAHLLGVREIPVAQQHGSLPRSSGVLDVAVGALSGLRHPEELGDVLGDGRYGLDAPHWALVGEPFTIRLTGTDDPAAVDCLVEETTGSGLTLRPVLRRDRDVPGSLSAHCTVPGPGLYRVEISGGSEPVSQLVLAGSAADGD